MPLPQLNTSGPNFSNALMRGMQLKQMKEESALRQQQRETEGIKNETMLFELGKRYLSNIENLDDYAKFKPWAQKKFGIQDQFLPPPETFGMPGDEQAEQAFDDWRYKTILGLDEALKMQMEGDSVEVNIWRHNPENNKLIETRKITKGELKKNPESFKGWNLGKLEEAPGQEEGFTLSPGQTRYTAQGNALAMAPKEPEQFTLSEGQTRFDSKGKPIASVAKEPKTDNVTEEEKFLSTKRNQARSAIFKLYNMNEFSSVDETTSMKAGDSIEIASQLLEDNPKMSPSTAANQAKKQIDQLYKSLDDIPRRQKPGIISKGNRDETVSAVLDALTTGVDTRVLVDTLKDKGWSYEEAVKVIQDAASL